MVLFVSIAAGTLVMKTAFSNMSKVNAAAYLSGVLRQAADNVQSELENNHTSGQGRLNQHVTFSFTAKEFASGRNLSHSSSPGATGPVTGQYQLLLYEVDLVLTARNHEKNTNRRYVYKELIWKKQDYQ
jgi:hypothetical protein